MEQPKLYDEVGEFPHDYTPLGQIKKNFSQLEEIKFVDFRKVECVLRQSHVTLHRPSNTSVILLSIADGEGMFFEVTQVRKLVAVLENWLETGSFNGNANKIERKKL